MWLRDRAIGDRASEKSESIGMTSLASGSSLRVSMGLTVSSQMAKQLTVNRQKKVIFAVNCQKSRLKLTSSLFQLIFPHSGS